MLAGRDTRRNAGKEATLKKPAVAGKKATEGKPLLDDGGGNR